MAEVLRTVSSEDLNGYMPMREMLSEQHYEVYEVVGGLLLGIYESGGDLPAESNFIVTLNDRRQVAFSCGVCKVANTTDDGINFIQ